jgi:iron(III) transport system substrate-binding protein
VNLTGRQWVRLVLVFGLLASACRIETAAPGGPAQAATGNDPLKPRGDVWVYTSMYRHVLDALEPVLKKQLPDVTVHWYQAGSEKVAARLDAELAAGGTVADLVATSDPAYYGRLAREGQLRRYASFNGLRIPQSLVDPDGYFIPVRLSTMVLVSREGITDFPTRFSELPEAKFKGHSALPDPLTSGTAFTWLLFMRHSLGPAYVEALHDNRAVNAGGNAAVLQKVEGGEAQFGVVLLENALTSQAKGSAIEIIWPQDGAVVVPGHAAILKNSRNPVAAQALIDTLLSLEGQRVIVEKGDMHSVDPRLHGPRGQPKLDELLQRSQPWTAQLQEQGVTQGTAAKEHFRQVFSK